MHAHDLEVAPPGEPLARHAPPLPVGTLVVRSLAGRLAVPPREGREVVVGRGTDVSHVVFGGDDRAVSRRHLVLRHREDRWWLDNEGRRPVRLPWGVLPPGGDPIPLADGFTAAVVEGSSGRTHLVEMFVADGRSGSTPRPDDETIRPAVWPLSRSERDAVLVLGQRYLRLDPDPHPLTWLDAAEELQELDPGSGWTRKKVERTVTRIRDRLARRGVHGLRAEEIDGPVGTRLSDHLIRVLVDSATIVAADLAELEARQRD